MFTFKLRRTSSFFDADEYSLHRIQNYYPTLIVQAHKLKTICVENYRVHVSKSKEESRLKARKLMARVQQSNLGKIWEIPNEDPRPVVTVQIQDNSSKDWNNQRIGTPKMSYPEGLVNNISEKIEKSSKEDYMGQILKIQAIYQGKVYEKIFPNEPLRKSATEPLLSPEQEAIIDSLVKEFDTGLPIPDRKAKITETSEWTDE